MLHNEKLLAYEGQRAICRAYVATGHIVTIVRTRQHQTRISLDGGPRACIADAIAKIERYLTKTNQWHLAHAAMATA